MVRSPARSERPRWFLELPLLVGGYVAFGLVRAAIARRDPTATDNAVLVQRLERALHLAIEHPLNQAVLTHPVAVYATGYFYRLCVLAVPVTLLWLYARRPGDYRRLRTLLVAVTLLDLPLVALFPESPPRFAQAGIVDYMATHDILGAAAASVPRPGVNLLAAMPSMHVAWTTWSAWAMWSALRQDRPRIAGPAWALPALTALVVLATGHHYVLDVVGGLTLVALTLAGLMLAGLMLAGLMLADRTRGRGWPRPRPTGRPPGL